MLELRDDEYVALQALGRRYAELLPSDDHLEQIDRAHLAASPDDYEPLGDGRER